MIRQRNNTLIIFNFSIVLLLSSMNLNAALLVSEREIVVQSEQQWDQMYKFYSHIEGS